ncbi:MAG: hypothetical protein AB1598_05455 [Thermodesulfobacteriota bacterium]
MKNVLRFAAALILLTLPLRAGFAGDYSVETIASGVLGREPGVKNAVIRSGGEFAEAGEALGIKSPLPPVDFTKNAILLIAPGYGTGGIIEVSGVSPAAGGALEVRYRMRAEGPAPASPGKASYPYLMAKLSPAPASDAPVRFIDEDYVNAISSGTGLGQFREYTNVLSGGENARIAEYLPLDKGNTWTYKAETKKGPSEVTNSVVSESDGWSVFDSFFGVPGVGMKISRGGEILISSKGGVGTFYGPDVVTEFPEEPVTTPAGVFSGVMVVTMPGGGDFWFRDVYARGVGLISHEQNSRKGRAAYTLVGARVGGAEYPSSRNSSSGKN